MVHQYGAQRCCGGHNPHRIGTVAVGEILYIPFGLDAHGRQDGARPFGSDRPIIPASPSASTGETGGRGVRREPWIVEGWLNREYFPCVTGAPDAVYMTGGHLAQVRSLRTGRIMQVADWILLQAQDAA